jgi:mRNA interferase YafQ
MYQIVQTKKFTKSLKRLVGGGLKKSVQKDIQIVIDVIASGKKLAVGYRDHQLRGKLSDYRECHIQGDLLLVYQIVDREVVLLLIDLGSHNDIFG